MVQISDFRPFGGWQGGSKRGEAIVDLGGLGKATGPQHHPGVSPGPPLTAVKDGAAGRPECDFQNSNPKALLRKGVRSPAPRHHQQEKRLSIKSLLAHVEASHRSCQALAPVLGIARILEATVAGLSPH